MTDHKGNQEENKITEENMKDGDATEKPKSDNLSEEDLEKVSGGAFPTAVNSQITD